MITRDVERLKLVDARCRADMSKKNEVKPSSRGQQDRNNELKDTKPEQLAFHVNVSRYRSYATVASVPSLLHSGFTCNVIVTGCSAHVKPPS